MDYNLFKEKVEQLIEKRKSFHDNDPAIYKFWEEFADYMSIDQDTTIHFLDNCDAETTGWVSEVFEDVSERLKSPDFINCLERLAKRFPDQNLDSFIEDARSFL